LFVGRRIYLEGHPHAHRPVCPRTQRKTWPPQSWITPSVTNG